MKYRRLKRGDKIVAGTQYKWGPYESYCEITDLVWIRQNPIYNAYHPKWMRTPIRSKREEMIRAY